MNFELEERDGLARICELSTRHGRVTTPALLPVINPNHITIPPSEMKARFGAQIVITNSYIIRNDPGLNEAARKEGVHKVLGFDGPVMTDSGTFQGHVYGSVRVDPLEIVRFQSAIQSDIGTILDIFSEPDFTRQEAQEAVDETVRRASASVAEKGEMDLSGPVQGGIFLDLREHCAKALSELDLQVHPIGGVVPLLESYRFTDVAEIIIASKKGLDPSRPVHLFGAGHPMVFPMAVLLGCDMFDSASYAKFAREERMMYPSGTKALRDHYELQCDCPSCSSTTLEDLLAMGKEERIKKLAEHNLFTCFEEIRAIRNAIHEGSLWEYVEMRARAHPELLAALKILKHHKEFLERFEPASRRSAFFYCGPESYDRPTVARYQERFFSRYRRPNTRVLIGFEEAAKPYSRTYRSQISEVLKRTDASFIVASFFGPAPIELDEYYPIAQSVIPKEIDGDVAEGIRKAMERHAHQHGYPLAIMWEGEDTLKFLEEMLPEHGPGSDQDLLRCRAVLDVQFGSGAADILNGREVRIVKSERTGKIRNVFIDGEHALSMRASDGRFTLKMAGGRLLMRALSPPRMRVAVEDEPGEFAAKGNNVFAKFVTSCDPNIRPGDDVLVVNSRDELCAVGRALMNREEMLAFRRGIAARVKDSPD